MENVIKKDQQEPLIEAARAAFEIPGEKSFWGDVERQLEAKDAAKKPKVESRVAKKPA